MFQTTNTTNQIGISCTDGHIQFFNHPTTSLSLLQNSEAELKAEACELS